MPALLRDNQRVTIKPAWRVAAVLVTAVFAAVTSVNAQTATATTASPTVLTGDAARDAELRKWIDEFTDWQRWWSQWANRSEPGLVTSSRTRRARPSPPEWLDARCAEVIAPEDVLAPACALLEEWRADNATLKMRAARASVVQQGEAEPKSMWWEFVHVDLLWPATELRHSVYGVVGLHTATTIKDRLQIFLAPGVMLMNLPARDGSRLWKVAANYGVGFRLFDFTFPGNRHASLHVNIAKSWLMSDLQDAFASRSTDFAGFSISFKRR
jgi:hypothetical protein